MAHYVGRFAPSPTGPLHAGSLVAALASWLDARAHGGRWLVRIEDIDPPRCMAGADGVILRQLAALGLVPDEAPVWQSARGARYALALDRLRAQGRAYPCACTRKDIEAALRATGRVHQRHEEWVYPGTCRQGLQGRPARAWRLRCGDDHHPLVIDWLDRRLGPQCQDVTHTVGDFVLQRADGLWAYQLAVVVDDGAQAVTHVVRGEDLADNTPRQIHLQRLLGLPTPRYLHTPLVFDARGEKLSKQHGAPALDTSRPLQALQAAGRVLDLPPFNAGNASQWLEHAVSAWRQRWVA
ncbi:MAG: tRNA glutamyl-Q(34) synthetase GluQRS [Pseudomonadota bacterium]